MHRIVLNLEPVPASRPRVSRWATYYLPKYEQFKKDAGKLLMGNRTLYASPLKVTTDFYLTIPRSHSKKKRDEMDGQYCIGNVDIDNLEKAIYDSMNGTVWVDDKYIVANAGKKVWVKDGGRIEVLIEKINQPNDDRNQREGCTIDSGAKESATAAHEERGSGVRPIQAVPKARQRVARQAP